MDLPGITWTGPLLVVSLKTEQERTALCDGMISISMIISVIVHKLLFVRFKENSYNTVSAKIKVHVKDVCYFTILFYWAKLD
jgi:hypothetical protein